MAKSSLPVAIFVVFVAGGAVGGTAAALVMRAQVEPPDGRDHQASPREQEQTKRASTPSLIARASNVDAPHSVASSKNTTTGTPTTKPPFTDEGDPGTGAWLAESLAQLEEKYQAMMQREQDAALTTRTSAAPTDHELSLVDPTAGTDPPATRDTHTPELDHSSDTKAAAPLAPVVDASVPEQSYIAQANVTQNNTSTTHVTQVNQTMLMGYIPLLVPVPTPEGGQASSGPVQAVPNPTTPWVGLSPWAPIDMSRHHNPWKSSRLP